MFISPCPVVVLRVRWRQVSILRGFVKFLRIGVIAYVIGGIAYWTATELFLRFIGKEIVFSPVVSIVTSVFDYVWCGTG